MAKRGGAAGPFFVKTDGSPLNKPEFVASVRKVLAVIGYADKMYASHSFRIRAATAAANAGLEDSTIRMLGRWSWLSFSLLAISIYHVSSWQTSPKS